MLEVFYAGGTATRDFSAADIVAEIGAHGANAEFAPSREWLIARIADAARPGDLVLVMGARDPSLSALARAILAAIERPRRRSRRNDRALSSVAEQAGNGAEAPAVPGAALLRRCSGGDRRAAHRTCRTARAIFLSSP